MRKILICLTALLLLTACNNRNENTANDETGSPESPQSEMPVADSNERGQSEWIKQTTIMSSKPMVVDFYATWCGPCKQLAPVLDEIERNHKGEIIFKRIDVDQEPELTREFSVEAIPTLMFITPTGEYQTLMGYQDAPVIEAKIAELLTRSAH